MDNGQQARSQDVFWRGGGGGCVWRVKMQTCGGGGWERSGAMLPRENLRHLDCLGQHFARFHGRQKEKENVE